MSSQSIQSKRRWMVHGGWAMLAMLLLSACSYHPARIEPEPAVIIGDDHRHGDGDFCPTGQAKKGNC